MTAGLGVTLAQLARAPAGAAAHIQHVRRLDLDDVQFLQHAYAHLALQHGGGIVGGGGLAEGAAHFAFVYFKFIHAGIS